MIEEVTEKVRAALNESGYDALLVFGPDNVQYLSGAHLPFTYSYPDRSMALLWPRDGEPVCVCPVEWDSSFKNLSWIGETVGYTEMPADHSRVVGSIVGLAERKVSAQGGWALTWTEYPYPYMERWRRPYPRLSWPPATDGSGS